MKFRHIFLLSAYLLMMQTASAQQKLDIRSRGMIQQLNEQKAQGRKFMPKRTVLKSSTTDSLGRNLEYVDPMEPVLSEDGNFIEAFITTTDPSTLSRLQALGVKTQVTLGATTTCLIPLSHIDEVSSMEGVKRVRLSQRMRPLNDAARTASRVDQVHTYTPTDATYTGKGVIVGVVDQGIDFNHPAFNDTEGNSRILYAYLPDQSYPATGGYALAGTYYQEDGSSAEGYFPGYVYNTEDIKYLTTDTPQATHGTHVIGIAAGGRYGHDKYYGMAPDADIIAVGSTSFSDASITNGVAMMVQKAKELEKPLAVNLSLGTNLGAHDGSSALSRTLDALAGPGVVISISAGNEGRDALYIHKEANQQVATMLYDWSTQKYATLNKFYIDAWSREEKDFSLQLAVVDRSTNSIVASSNSVSATADGFDYTLFGEPSFFSNDITIMGGMDEESGKREILVYCSGDIEFTDSNYAMALVLNGEAEVDMWTCSYLEFDNCGYSNFVSGNSDASYNDVATGHNTICVGAYTTKTQWTSADGYTYHIPSGTIDDYASFSSYGVGIDGRRYPTISAPGQLLASAYSKYDDSYDESGYLVQRQTKDMRDADYVLLQGTSMAAPCATGIIALWMQVEPTLSVEDVREVFEHTAAQDIYTGNTPIRFGYGKIDALAGIEYLLSKKAPAHTHSWDEAWSHDEKGHWHACTETECDITDYSTCKEADAAYAEHSFGDEGEERYTCLCSYVDEERKTAAEAADQMAANKSEFATYKEAQKLAAQELAEEGDPESVAALIDAAISDIDALTYYETLSLEDNKARVDAILATLEEQIAQERLATSIRVVNSALKHGRIKVFTLSGQPVQKVTHSGVYIINNLRTLVR